MDINRINTVFNWLKAIGNQPNCLCLSNDITNIKNGLIRISEDICKEYPFFSNELFSMKDQLFYGAGFVNPFIWGRIVEILKTLQESSLSQSGDIWNLVHPVIVKISKQLYLDGHYSNAACDAFIEINDRMKRLYKSANPSVADIPDGTSLMNKMLADNLPVITVDDITTDTGKNIQSGTRFMLAGAMSALRNPKAHANISITKEDAMRRLMFASMLMYQIDDAVKHSGIVEK